MNGNINTKYENSVKVANSLLCVGLDTDVAKIPKPFQSREFPQYEFNKHLIEQTGESASAFKLNSAFYEARGDQGIRELKMSIEYIKSTFASAVIILDAKRADIGNTNEGYVSFAYDYLGVDAITVHPYLGREAIQPFLDREDKATIILCRTSNPGAPEFQDLERNGVPLWQIVARHVVQDWNQNDNCMLVVGATYPDELRAVREIAPSMNLLIPGIGAQGGETAKVVSAGQTNNGMGMIVAVSRSIIFSADPAGEARKLRDEINQYRK